MTTPQDIVRADALAMSSYPVPDAAGLIKLDAMKKSVNAARRFYAETRRASGGRRAEPLSIAASGVQLLARFKRTMHVPDACDGSDELISIMATVGAKIVAPTPGFVMYEMSAVCAHLDFVGVPRRFHARCQRADRSHRRT